MLCHSRSRDLLRPIRITKSQLKDLAARLAGIPVRNYSSHSFLCRCINKYHSRISLNISFPYQYTTPKRTCVLDIRTFHRLLPPTLGIHRRYLHSRHYHTHLQCRHRHRLNPLSISPREHGTLHTRSAQPNIQQTGARG